MARTLTGMMLGLGLMYLLCSGANQHASARFRNAKIEEPRSTRVALIDMGKIFKISRSFEKKRDSLKAEIEESTTKFKSLQEKLQQLKKEHDSADQGSEEKASLERQLKTKAAEFEKLRGEEQRRFLKAEAQIYLEVYEDICTVTSTYAREHEIDLVIRTNSEPLEKDDPTKMLTGMNRIVIYENSLDITDEIIAAMKS